MDDYQINQSEFIRDLGHRIGELESDLIALRILVRMIQGENDTLRSDLAEARELVARFQPE